MTDREKAIRLLNNTLRHCHNMYNHVTNEEQTWLAEINQGAKDALALLKEQKSEWLEDSCPGQEYGTTWACMKCMHSIHRPYAWNPYNSGYKYCPHCGSKMVVKLDV